FWVITALLVLSVLIKHFWCRYLCPYGSILGVLGFLSMGKIQRNNENCIKCGNCESVCPGKISLMDKGRVHSLECSACLGCVDVCPSKNAIGFSLFSGRMILNQKKIALVLIVFFMGGITIAKGTGHWQNNTSVQAYRQHVLFGRMPERIPAKMDPEKMRRMIEKMRRQMPPPQ
ncbi:MAG: 4Fe-4S binding protein, partial [Proteobacteria bacterium]|nr:4Fe-4S binding protein [Pseudomonadota bacterium]